MCFVLPAVIFLKAAPSRSFLASRLFAALMLAFTSVYAVYGAYTVVLDLISK